MRKSILKHVLSTLTLTSVLLGTVVTPAMAATGDFYDTTAMIHYSSVRLQASANGKSHLAAAYAKGEDMVKAESNGTFLDYNAAYAKFVELISSGKGYPITQIMGIITIDPSLYRTIDTTKYTDFTDW
jgi:hypothetical protein